MPRVLACFRKFDKVPDEIINGAARSSDTYIRQAATLLMAEKSSVDQLGNMLQSGDAPARLARRSGCRVSTDAACGDGEAGRQSAACQLENAGGVQD